MHGLFDLALNNPDSFVCFDILTLVHFQYQLQGLQTKPVVQKCREVQDILKKTSTKVC